MSIPRGSGPADDRASPIGVIFDMDGVLVDSGHAHYLSWRRLAEERGKRPMDEAEFKSSFGGRSAEIIARWFGETREEIVKSMDERKEAIYRELIRGQVPAMPGAVELVAALHAADIRIAVGSSGPPENIDLVCDEMGLRPYLSAIVTGMDVQRGKPDPQVFLLAAERMGTRSTATVVIEDAPLGVEAAKRAGMRCIALTSSHPGDVLHAADEIVTGLAEIGVDRVRRMLNR